jgi:hypothetical protein
MPAYDLKRRLQNHHHHHAHLVHQMLVLHKRYDLHQQRLNHLIHPSQTEAQERTGIHLLQRLKSPAAEKIMLFLLPLSWPHSDPLASYHELQHLEMHLSQHMMHRD